MFIFSVEVLSLEESVANITVRKFRILLHFHLYFYYNPLQVVSRALILLSYTSMAEGTHLKDLHDFISFKKSIGLWAAKKDLGLFLNLLWIENGFFN